MAQRTSIKQNTLGRSISKKWDSFFNRFCEWPGLYSLLFTCLAAGSLIYMETQFGAKIWSLSTSQILLVLFVIFVVAKNVFIPSRANRFIENTKPADASTIDKAKLNKLPGPSKKPKVAKVYA